MLDLEEKGDFPIDSIVVKDITQRYEDFLKYYLKEYGYYDIYIIDPSSSHVIYTAKKASDYGANLKYGSLKDSALAKVYKDTMKNNRTTFVDMQAYAPNNNKPTMFLGTPIKDEGGETIAILVFKISDRTINTIMQFREGYGKTQEDYLVGQDLLMRSDSYLNPKEYSLEKSFANKTKIDTIAARNALKGKENTELIMDYNHHPVLSAYAKIEVGKDFNWAIISEIDEAEVLITPNGIRNLIIIISLVVLILVMIGTIIVINNIIVKKLKSFQEGLLGFFDYINKDAKVVQELQNDNEDEIGLMSKVVNENILKAKKSIEEDRAIIDETIKVLGEFGRGDLNQRITTQVNNPSLNQLRDVLNKMADNLEHNIGSILKVLEEFSQYNYTNSVDTSEIK